MAQTLSDFRKSYPQYDDLDDDTLARALHEKHYSDIDFGEFSKQIGYSVPAEAPTPTPARETEVAPRKAPKVIDEEKMRTRATLSDATLKGESKTDDEIADVGTRIRRMMDLDIYDPSAYYMTQDEVDAVTLDKVQAVTSKRQEQLERANTEVRPVSGVAGDDQRGFWKLTKAVFGNWWEKGTLGAGIRSKDAEILRQQNISLGQIYLERLNAQYDDLGEEGQELIDTAAAQHGLDSEQYAKFTANQIDSLTEEVFTDLDRYAEIQDEIAEVRPEGGWMSNIASMVIENTPQIGYIAAGVATRNPITTISMMGTDVYANTYANARREGRGAGDAAKDAMAATFIEAATEGVPVGKFISLLKAGKKSKARKIFEGLLTEGAQEVLAEGGQILYDIGELDKDIGWGEAFSRMRDAGVVGMVIGGGIAAPVAMMADDTMADAQTAVKDAAAELKSVAMRVQDPAQRVTKAEIDTAKKAFVDAQAGMQKLVQEREQAAVEKKEAKQQKKTEKRRRKMTPTEAKRDVAREAQGKADQALKGPVTPKDLEQADLMERIGVREISKKDAEGVSELLDAGYAKITPSGNVILNDAAKRRLRAVRAAERAAAAPEAAPAEVITPVKYERPEDRQARREREAAARGEPIIKPKKFTSAQKRQQQLEARVNKKVTDEKVRTKIADAIIKADQETEMIEKREKRRAVELEKKKDKDYDLAVKQLRKEDADVAEGLVAMDEKSVSGYQGTRLGDVLRDAMARVERAEKKATAELKDSFWNKPVQGTLFDVGTVLAKGTKDYANVVKVGSLKLAKIGLKYGAWSADMVGQFGESVKPVLARVYSDAKKNLSNVMRISHERFKTGPRKGQLKYAPTQYAEAQKVNNLRRQLERLTREGEGGRFWYEKTGKGILEATGSVEEARKLSGLLAIYSSGTAVSANLTNALKMWADYKAGDLKIPLQGTKAGRFREQDQTAVAWLQSKKGDEHFVESFGPKRFPFFTNIMRAIDPANYETGQGATVDLWIMRAFGYHADAPTDPQNAFSATEIQKIAEKLGWEKQQVQAAIWVSIKARWEFIQKRAKQRAVDEGKAEFTKGQRGQPVFTVLGSTREEQIELEKDIITIFREEAMRASKKEITKKLEESKRDFADYMERHYATISWEAEPSTTLGLDINKMPLQAKVEMQAEIAQLLTNPDTGREYLAEWLGLLGMDQFHGPGSWEMNLGTAVQNSVIAPPQHKGDGQTVQKTSKQALDGYAAILGYLLKQDAVAWHRPFYSQTLKSSNGVEILTKTLTYGQTKALYAHIMQAAAKAGIDASVSVNWAPIVMDGAVRILNFPEFTDVQNRKFHSIVSKAMDNMGMKGNIEVFASDGDLIGNDWSTDKKGEGYVKQIDNNQNAAVKKTFERAKRKFSKGLAEIYAKYAREYQAYPSEPAQVAKAGQEGKKPKGMLRFRHFSKAEPGVIRVDKFGTGIKGAERSRGSMPVISAYPDKGFKKEVGLGPNEYVIDVVEQNMYDLDADPLGFKEGSKEPQTFDGNMRPIKWRTDINKLEALVKEAGYVGYLRPKAEGNLKGQARFFVDLPVEGVNMTFSLSESPTIQIRENESDEFEVRERDGEVYYTPDLEDAIDTAKYIWGDFATFEIVDEFGDVRDVVKPEASPDPVKVKLSQSSSTESMLAVDEMMDEFFEETSGNPLSPDERIFDNKVALSIRPQGGMMWLDSIRSFTRGEGHASEAFDTLLDMADRHGVITKMFAKPFGEDGLTRSELVTWYKSRGFAFDGGDTMVRVPRPPKDVKTTYMIRRLRGRSKPTNDGQGLPVHEVERYADSFAKTLNMPRDTFVVLESIEGLPGYLYNQVVRYGYAGSLQGVYYYDAIYGPKVYVIANNMWEQSPTTNGKRDGPINPNYGKPSVKQMQEVFIHETLGHFGIRAFLGPKKYNQFMRLIQKAYPDEVKYRGRQMRKEQSGRNLAAEEVFAYRVQAELRGLDLTKSNTSLIAKIVQEFKLILAKLGLRKINDQDMIDMMFRVAEFARKADEGRMSKIAGRTDRMETAMQQMEVAERRTRESAGDPAIAMTLSEVKAHKGKLRFEYDEAGGMQVFDENGKALGYILPTVSDEVLRSSPGIQSWSVNGSKTSPTVKSTFSMLGNERKVDPDLDRFLNKISHGKTSKLDSLIDWWANARANWREATEREVFDMYAGIRRREQELGIFGEQSGYMSVRLSAGVDVMIRSAIEHGVPIWEDGWVKIDEGQMSLLDVLAPISQNKEMLKMFEAFIVARRAKFLSKEQRENLMSREEIASVLKYVRKHKLYGLFRDTQRDLSNYKKQVLNFAQEAGVINKETRQLWERADHVPFYRVLTQNDKVGPFAASRMGHIKNPIRRLTGGAQKLRPPLDSIVQNLSMLMEASIKNRAMTDVVNNFNGTGIVTKAPQAEMSSALIPLDQIQDRLDEAGVSIDAVGRDMLKGISKLTSLQAPTDENVVSILENGKKQYYYVHDPSIMRGLESVTPKQWSALMRVLRAPKKWLTWSITRMPDFILKNWFRDMWHAWVLTRHGTIAPGYDSVKGWAKSIAQDQTFRDMMSGGGVFQAGYVNAADPRGTDMAIRKKVLGKGRHGILDTPHKLWRFYTHIADGAENAHRVAVYQKALAKTGSRKQALFESRDLMDFSVRGAHPIIRFLVETVPFWGARMQGIQRTYKGFKEDWKTTMVRAVPIVIASVAYYAYIRDDERYKSLNDYDKRMYYHFFDVFEKGDHWRLPKPFEIGAFFSSIPEVLTEFTLSEQPDRGKALAQSIYFIGAEMLSLGPQVQIGMPFWELYTNENSFTGVPIVPHHMREGNMPEGQYDYRTNVTMKWLAQNMPEGAPEFMRSPKQLEHLVRGYFGSLMDYTFVATDHIYHVTHQDEATPPERRYDEIPFIKSFRREERGKYDMYIDQMYDTMEEADKVYRRVKQLRDERETEEARELELENRPLLLARARMGGAEKQVSAVNKQIRQTYERENLSPTEKREKIDKLLERRSKIAERVYDYRPGGTKNKYEGGEKKQSYYDAILESLTGKPKSEQVGELISNNLPHTATLINDMKISPEKLGKVV